jgi:hypothetical protein
MTILLTTLILPAAAAMLAAPEAATTTLAFVAAGIGIALHVLLPPAAEENAEAILRAASAGM